MNGRILVDTNILVELLSGNQRIANYIDQYELCISAITKIELLSNPSLSKSDILIVQKLVQSCSVFDQLNAEIIKYSAEYRRKKRLRKTPDAIIAATAKYYNLSLITMDSEFENIHDLDIVLIA